MAVALGSCTNSTEKNAQTQLDVIASFYPIYDVVSRVGGPHIKVTDLTPAGAEPHELELSPEQVEDIGNADLIFYLGNGFQPAVERAAERSDARLIDLLDVRATESSDPHIWLDPALMIRVANKVESELTKARPSNESTFSRNARAYEAKLESLDTSYENGLVDCATRSLVTTHASFGHLSKRYKLRQESLSGLSPESEPSPSRLAELTDIVEARNVSTVFYETLVPKDLAVTLAREAHVTTAVLNPIEGLTPAQARAGADYFSLMRQNLEALRKGLGCK